MLVSTALSLLTLPSAAQTEPALRTSPEPSRDWIVSVGAIVGVMSQDVRASVDSRDSGGNPLPLRSFNEGDDVDMGPFLGGTFELVSPEIPLPLRPRGFVGVEVLANFATGRAIANEGNPTGITTPGPPPFDETEFLGVGSRTRVERARLSYGAFLGVSLPFEAWGLSMNVRPSIRWLRFSVEGEGTILAALKPNAFLPTFREIELRSQSEAEFDALGPGLELEVEIHRREGQRLMFFAGGGAYRILGDRDLDFGATSTISDSLGTETYQSQHTVEVDEWLGRAYFGVRMHFSDLFAVRR